MSPTLRKWLAALTLTAPLTTTLPGCSITRVEATERGNLAREVMQRDVVADRRAAELHAYTSKENTAGGYAVGGGGCGCN